MTLPVLVAKVMISTASATNLEWSKKPNGGISTYKKGVYCGPGWGYTYKDILDGKISEMPEAVDAIDRACQAHDVCYEENGYLTQGCNLVLTADLAAVVVSSQATGEQRVDAAVMAAIFFVESQTIDLGQMAVKEYSRMRDRMLGYVGESMHTLEQAINREILMRSSMPGWAVP